MTVIWHTWRKTKRPSKPQEFQQVVSLAGGSSAICDVWQFRAFAWAAETVSCKVKQVKGVLARLHHPPAWEGRNDNTPQHFLSFYFSLAWGMIRVGRSTSICHKGLFGAVSKSLLSLEQNHWTVWISHACHWLLARWPFLKRWFSMRRQSSTEIRPHNTMSIRTAEVTVERGRPNNTVQLVQ